MVNRKSSYDAISGHVSLFDKRSFKWLKNGIIQTTFVIIPLLALLISRYRLVEIRGVYEGRTKQIVTPLLTKNLD